MKLYGEITKAEEQNDGTIKVWGYASSSAVDADGETITPDAMKAAIPDYMKFGAVREMHGKSAAGTAIEARVEDDGRTIFGAHVVDPIAVKKVQAGVYKGFSIGGKVTARDDLNKSVIKGLSLVEISLVDRPANPDAVFTCYKADGVPAEGGEREEDEKEDEEEKPKAEGGAKGQGADAGKGEEEDADDEKAEAKKEGKEAAAGADVLSKALGDMRAAVDALQQALNVAAPVAKAAAPEGKQAVSGGDALQKMQQERDDALSKAEALAKRVAELEAKPDEGKAIIKTAAISKAADGGGNDMQGFTGIPNYDGSLNEAATLIKAAHAGLLK